MIFLISSTIALLLVACLLLISPDDKLTNKLDERIKELEKEITFIDKHVADLKKLNYIRVDEIYELTDKIRSLERATKEDKK